MMFFAYLVYLGLSTATAAQIVSGPQSITDATIGSSVRFECILSSVTAHPSWNIDGTDYQVTLLPSGYEYMSISYSKILIVTSVRPEMNNSCYYCYVLTFQGRQESERAKLNIELLTTMGFSLLLPGFSPEDDTITPLLSSIQLEKSASASVTVTSFPSTSSLTHIPLITVTTVTSFPSTSSLTTIPLITVSIPKIDSTPVNTGQPTSSGEPILPSSIHIYLTSAALVIIMCSTIVICSLMARIVCYRKIKYLHKSQSTNAKEFPVYEEVTTVTSNPPLHNNGDIYLKHNVAYVTTQNTFISVHSVQ